MSVGGFFGRQAFSVVVHVYSYSASVCHLIKYLWGAIMRTNTYRTLTMLSGPILCLLTQLHNKPMK